MKAIIVGGGIAGLASAFALTRRGWQVEVFERAPEFTKVGAGLSLLPPSPGPSPQYSTGRPEPWSVEG